MLIKPWAMMADNHRKMSHVLLDEPSDLYINDLRTALMKFKDLENDVKQIADLNTNIQIEYVADPKNDDSVQADAGSGEDSDHQDDDLDNQENDEEEEEEDGQENEHENE